MNTLSRNVPVCLVVGAAGFLGSHFTEKMISEGVQIVGVDDLSTGSLINLSEATKSQRLHFINQSTVSELELPRLDYAVFMICEELPRWRYLHHLEGFLALCRVHTPKILLVSSIDLYANRSQLSALKEGEERLAKFASSHKLNARIVRLADVFGPRMHFRGADPILPLILSALRGELRNGFIDLEFSTRALSVGEVTELLVRSLLHGGTVHKIYDGARLHPVKLSEIKQILNDPLWHQNTNFTPTELPAWPTPNLVKTQKELSWQAGTPMVVALRETLAYFSRYPDRVPKESAGIESKLEEPEPAEQVERSTFKGILTEDPQSRKSSPKQRPVPIVGQFKKHGGFILGMSLIVIGILFPLVDMAVNGYVLGSNLASVNQSLAVADFPSAQRYLQRSQLALAEVKDISNNYLLFKSLRLVWAPAQNLEAVLGIGTQTVEATEHAIKGTESLYGGFQIINGEREGDIKSDLTESSQELTQAIGNLGYIQTQLQGLSSILPSWLLPDPGPLTLKIKRYQSLLADARTLSNLLPDLIGAGQSSILVVFEDDRILRPAGGQLLVLSEISFNDGRVGEINSRTVSELDRNLSEHVEPPSELKADLNLARWSLKESNADPNHATSSRNILWFYQKQTGRSSKGVVIISSSGVQRLLEVLGPVSLENSDSISSKNFQDKLGLSPDPQQFVKEVGEEVLKRALFVPQKNWLHLSEITHNLLNSHQLAVYLVDPKLDQVVLANNWAPAAVSVAKEEKGSKIVQFSWSEINLNQVPVDHQIQRRLRIGAQLLDNGHLDYSVTFSYLNSSSDQSFSNKLKLQTFPVRRLTGVQLGREGVLSQVTSFSESGVAGYAYTFNLLPKEQKELVWEFKDQEVEEIDKQMNLKFKLIRPVVINNLELSFKLNLPKSWQVKYLSPGQLNGDQLLWEGEFDQDKTFEVSLQR